MLNTKTRRAQHAGAAVKYNLFILYMAQADDATGKGPTSEGRARPSKWKTRSPSAQVKSARLSDTVERPRCLLSALKVFLNMLQIMLTKREIH